MDLAALRSHWDRLGSSDPLWSILTAPERRFGGWSETEFFETGVQEIGRIFAELDKLGVEPIPGRALDFGCGVGRLTAALADRFDEVVGVDIAPSMVAAARHRFDADQRMKFHLLGDDGLAGFPAATFDFIFTAHVLQHMEPRFSERYVRDFVRLLAPTGVAVVQITTEPYVAPEPVVVADSCLTAGGYRARLGVIRTGDLRPGKRVTVTVLVVNESDQTWRARGRDGWFQVTLANRWLTPAGAVVVSDDGRAHLPRDMAPGEALASELEVTVPTVAGSYLLEIDLVQEGCAWFQDRGSTPARIRVDIPRPNRRGQAVEVIATRLPRALVARVPRRVRLAVRKGGGVEPPPIMEMYGVPEDTVRRWVDEEGGRLVGMIDYSNIGDPGTDWVRRIFVFAGRNGRT